MTRLQFLQKNRQGILDLAKKHKVTNVRVFGSIVRGEETEKSDIDFLVTLEKDASLMDRGGLLIELQEYLGCPVDVVSDRTIHPLLRDEILFSAIVL